MLVAAELSLCQLTECTLILHGKIDTREAQPHERRNMKKQSQQKS